MNGVKKMSETTVYIAAKRHVVAKSDDVHLEDIATVYCEDKIINTKMKSIKVHHFEKQGEQRCVISIMRLIELITKLCPEVSVESLGETETIIKSNAMQNKENKSPLIKMAFVATICFIGTAFTIIAFHNDIGITNVFAQIFYAVTGEKTNFHTALEFSYAVGLTIGILVFYNRFGKRQVEKDPTPLAVEMRIYESQVDDAIVEMAERESKLVDVGNK